jgi:DNA mismatch repair protein MSH4
MSGKSTYLRQVGLLVVQGLLGCRCVNYVMSSEANVPSVPADYASIRPHDALLSRLSNEGKDMFDLRLL